MRRANVWIAIGSPGCALGTVPIACSPRSGEVHRSVENAWNQSGVGIDPFRDQVRRALCMAHFVRRDAAEQIGKHRLFALLAQAAEEVVRPGARRA